MEINLKNIEFVYEGSEKGALKINNLTIAAGEFIVLMGESGCGKTTMTRLINGLCPYFYKGKLQGEVSLDGKAVSEMESYELAQRVGSVFQNPRTQFFNTDTDSEMAFGLENQGMMQDAILARMEEVTHKLKIEKLRNRDIFQLSGGEKQKIAFASVYAMSPQVYVLDEPSSNLDESGINDLKQCLQQIKAEGKTVMIAEHRLYYLTDLADKFVFLEKGEIKKVMSATELKELPTVALKNMGLRAAIYQKIDVQKHQKECLESDKNTGMTLEHLRLFRNKTTLAGDINLHLQKGKVYGVVGENGSGKTTFLRTLAGLHKDYQGNISIAGMGQSPKQLQKRAYLVMQDVNYQLFAESVNAECTLGVKNPSEEKTENALSQMGLLEYRDRHPNTLSGGQKQRLSMAVSMAYKKDLLLFDEPTSGLDGKNMLKIAEVIQTLAEHGKYVVVVTHDYEFLNQCCDAVIDFQQYIEIERNV